jgi:hypothetical protein
MNPKLLFKYKPRDRKCQKHATKKMSRTVFILVTGTGGGA